MTIAAAAKNLEVKLYFLLKLKNVGKWREAVVTQNMTSAYLTPSVSLRLVPTIVPATSLYTRTNTTCVI
jgi:hypothetical protein